MREQLKTEYRELTGSRADGRWTIDTLVDKINQVKVQAEKNAQYQREQEAERAAVEAERTKTIKDRGDWDTYADSASRWGAGEAIFFRSKRIIDSHEKIAAKLAEKFLENPSYAMQWSTGYFEHAAEYHIAKQIKYMFEEGMHVDDIIETLKDDFMRTAGHVARSTSQCSNMMEDCRREALYKMIRDNL